MEGQFSEPLPLRTLFPPSSRKPKMIRERLRSVGDLSALRCYNTCCLMHSLLSRIGKRLNMFASLNMSCLWEWHIFLSLALRQMLLFDSWNIKLLYIGHITRKLYVFDNYFSTLIDHFEKKNTLKTRARRVRNLNKPLGFNEVLIKFNGDIQLCQFCLIYRSYFVI